MICKFFETYTDVSAKLISILVSLYDKVFFIKPMTSKPSISEKYIVCIGFKISDTSSIVKKLEKINSKLQDLPNDLEHILLVRENAEREFEKIKYCQHPARIIDYGKDKWKCERLCKFYKEQHAEDPSKNICTIVRRYTS